MLSHSIHLNSQINYKQFRGGKIQSLCRCDHNINIDKGEDRTDRLSAKTQVQIQQVLRLISIAVWHRKCILQVKLTHLSTNV